MSDEFITQVKKGWLELVRAEKMASDKGEYQRAQFVQNAIDQLNALIHLERITKK